MIIKIGRFFKVLLLFLWLMGSTAWAVLAVNFGDSSSSTAQLIILIAVALIGLTAMISLLFVSSFRKQMLIVHAVIFSMVILWWINIEPANDRLWQ